MPRRNSKRGQRILIVAERPQSILRQHLAEDFDVMETFTTDRAVAVCVNNPVDAVVLDHDCFIETDGWSVAQSIKAARSDVCVLLASRALHIADKMPKGVDAVVPADDPELVRQTLEFLTGHSDMAGKVVRSRHPAPLAQWLKGT